jgi:hypothetical protein
MQTISEDVLRRVADVLGASTGAAKALDEGLRLRSQGLEVFYWKRGSCIVVESRKPASQGAGVSSEAERVL